MRGSVGLVVAAALALATCGGDDDASGDDVSSTTDVIETSTTPADTGGTLTPTTAVASTTMPPTTAAPTSTVTPTTTVAPATTDPGPLIVIDEQALIDRDNTDVLVTPNGAREIVVLKNRGPAFGASLDDAPAHNAVTVRFDIVIFGPWDGYDGEVAGVGTISTSTGSARIISDFFSNTPGSPQSFPLGRGRGETDPLTGAVEIDTLGFDQDAVFPVEYTFAHDDNDLSVSFSGFPPLVDSGYGIDNLEVELLRVPSSEIATEIDIVVQDGLVTITGSVPTDEDRDDFVGRLRDDLGDRLVSIEIDLVGGIRSSWMGSTGSIARALEGVTDLRWQLGPSVAIVSGVVPEELSLREFRLRLLSVGARGYSLRSDELVEAG